MRIGIHQFDVLHDKIHAVNHFLIGFRLCVSAGLNRFVEIPQLVRKFTDEFRLQHRFSSRYGDSAIHSFEDFPALSQPLRQLLRRNLFPGDAQAAVDAGVNAPAERTALRMLAGLPAGAAMGTEVFLIHKLPG